MTLVEQYYQKGFLEGFKEELRKIIPKVIAEAREPGKNETILKIAHNLLKENFSPEVVAKATALTIEKISLKISLLVD
ncbi:MAG TPA: hypothetical protein VHE99_04460 [Gammaproteobacteria bacterium]|nr:hypothetical protein [Gammaproteobacteria bacterium]